jgi:mannan endo-1,4-beta-mannosidase
MKKILLFLFSTFILSNFSAQNFIKVNNHFIKNGKPYYFIGTNYWYGGMLGTKNGNRERLKKN